MANLNSSILDGKAATFKFPIITLSTFFSFKLFTMHKSEDKLVVCVSLLEIISVYISVALPLGPVLVMVLPGANSQSVSFKNGGCY